MPFALSFSLDTQKREFYLDLLEWSCPDVTCHFLLLPPSSSLLSFPFSTRGHWFSFEEKVDRWMVVGIAFPVSTD